MTTQLPTAEQPVVLKFGHSRWTWLFLLTIFCAFGWGLWQLGMRGIAALLWFAVSAAVVALFCVVVETQLFTTRVVRIWRLFGRMTVRQHEFSLASFRGVEQRRLGVDDDISWQVGLLHGSGKFMVVQGFGGGTETEPPEECRTYSRQLAQVTGLPLLHEQPSD